MCLILQLNELETPTRTIAELIGSKEGGVREEYSGSEERLRVRREGRWERAGYESTKMQGEE